MGRLEEEPEQIKAFNVEGLTLGWDVSSSVDCKQATAKVLEKLGAVDIFAMNNKEPESGRSDVSGDGDGLLAPPGKEAIGISGDRGTTIKPIILCLRNRQFFTMSAMPYS
jgi:hypothetical protein